MKKFLCFLLTALMVIPYCSFAEGEEVLFSSSFEDGLKGWTYYTADTLFNSKVTSSCATDGKKSIYILDDKNGASFGVRTDYVEVVAGQVYSASVDCYLVDGSVKAWFKYFDENKNQLSNQSQGGTAGKWKNLVVSYEAPEGAKYAQFQIASISASFGKAYFDNVKIVKGALSPYEITDASVPSGEESLEVELPELVTKFNNCELIFSDSFENGIEGWDYNNSTMADHVMVKEDNVYDGKKAVYMLDDTLKTAPGIKSSFIEIEAGKTYSSACYMYGINNKSIKVWLKFFDKDKKALLSKSHIAPLEGVWGEVACSAQAPEGAKYAQVLVAGVSSTLGAAYADNIRLYKGIYNAQLVEKKYIAPKQVAPVDSKIIAPVDGKLVYSAYTDKGDKISDYSYAGFYAGDYELPVSANLPVVEILSASGKDDTDMIQAAIDKAERKDGGINIVKLKAGTYYINAKGLRVKSGVLLSGEGQGPTGTILYAYTPSQHIPFKIQGEEPAAVGEKAYITNDYLPAGAKTLNLSDEDIKNFKVGDLIAICHNSTEKWSDAIGMMGTINVYDDVTSWLPDKVNMITERVITKISGNEITLDFSIFVPHMKELVPSYVTKVDDSKKVTNAGMENLRVVSYFNGAPDDEEHATAAISITNAKNIFLRDITGKYFYTSVVTSGRRAVNVTARNVSCIEPVSKITGARRYSFAATTSAQQILYTGCYSHDGRHDFETSYSVTGPISYVDNLVDGGNTGTETHGTWSTGVLFDNIYHIGHDTKGFIAFSNRGLMGTQLSQGWTSASAVAWNCLAGTILVHKPPLTYQNFSVGMWGQYTDSEASAMKKKHISSGKRLYRTGKSTEHTEANFATDANTSFVGDGYKEAQYTPVNPRSLYKAQLSERYTGTILNARPNAPIIVTPKADAIQDENEITINGVYQLGAEKVTVYVDNKAYNATLKPETNEFTASVSLDNGTHKIYATQIIGGVEGNKTADRFILINELGENHDYLQSIYPPEAVRMIINDPRPTYDEVINGIKVKVFGHLLYSDVAPTEVSGRVLVPMRAIFEKLNAEISWDEGTSTAMAKKGGTEVKITENSTKAYINGNEVTLDVPATIINGRFVVPVRFISEAFGAKVNWIDETKTVTIEY